MIINNFASRQSAISQLPEIVLLPFRNDTTLVKTLDSQMLIYAVLMQNPFKESYIVSPSSVLTPYSSLKSFEKLCFAALSVLWIIYVLIRKLLGIKAFAKWINANVACPIAALFIEEKHVFF